MNNETTKKTTTIEADAGVLIELLWGSFFKHLWFAVISFLVAMFVLSLSPFGRDDTDSSSWGGGRSGFTLRTDALTGCQYLSTSAGITPRFDSAGRHLGCKQ